MVRGAARDEFDPVEFQVPEVSKGVGRDDSFLKLNPSSENVYENVGCLVNFLEHEMRVLPLVYLSLGYVDFFMAPVHEISRVFNGSFPVHDMHEIPIFQIDDIRRVTRDTIDVRREKKTIVLTLGKHEGASELYPDHFGWIGIVDKHDGIRSFQPRHEFLDPFEKALALDSREEFGRDFRVGIPVKRRSGNLLLEFPVIFNDSVMYHENRFFLVGMRVGIFEIDDSMGGPPGMPDPARVFLVGRFGILHESVELGYFPYGFIHIDTGGSMNGDSRGVVPSVFQFFQSFENYFFSSGSRSNISKNSTHESIVFK